MHDNIHVKILGADFMPCTRTSLHSSFLEDNDMTLFRSVSDLTKCFYGSPRKTSRPNQGNSTTEYGSLEPRQLMATIAWTSGILSGPDVVSTNGSLVFAINGSASTGTTTTANGVDFVASTRANAGSIAQGQSPGSESFTTTLGADNQSSFSNGGIPGVLGSLIEGGWFGAASGDSASINLTGLTAGETYELQIFASDARGSRDNTFITRLDDGDGGIGVDLSLNNQPFNGRAGDFGLGTFVADGSTQSFNLTGFIGDEASVNRIQVNAIQLRRLDVPDLAPGAIPLINEFLASNASVIDDDNGNASDFIEIFNAGEDSLNLSGYSLTDDPADPTKFVFSDTPLAGGQYLVVFAGDDLDPTSGTDIFTGFGLSSGGDYIGLFDPAGNLVSEFGSGGSNFPAQSRDVSYGYVDNGNFNQASFFSTPTPGAANVDPVSGVIESLPTVSVDRGFHEEAFTVDVVSQTRGAVLIYTTDGTEPSLTNGIEVLPANANAFAELSLTISSTTTLRTASFLPGVFTRATTTHTYIFIDDVITSDVLDTDVTQDPRYSGLLRDALLDIPTISFNFDNEILDNTTPEQRASIEYLAPDGSEGFQIDAGISAFGGAFTEFAKRSFRVNFSSEFGESRLEFPLFEGFDDGVTPATDSFSQLNFRSGSQDRAQRGFGLANRFVDETLLDAGHIVPHGRFVHIYLNGTYWGQYHLRERFNDDFLESYYGGDDDDYEAINGNVNNGNNTPNGWSPGTIFDGSGDGWRNINNIVNDLSLSPAQRFEALSQVVDLEQYIDFVLVYTNGRSENEYRAGGSSDGSVPFTFFFNDADGWLRGGDNGLENAGPGNILGQLLEDGDPDFLTLYSDRIQRLFGDGGALSVEQSTARLQELIDQVELSVILEAARWGNGGAADPMGGSLSVEEFQSRAQNALNNILPEIVEGGGGIFNRYRALGLFPDADAPEILVNGTPQFNGEITPNSQLSFVANDPVYFTLDGSDPRLPGGGLNPNAFLASDVGVTNTSLVQTGDQWRFYDSPNGLDGIDWQSTNFNDSAWELGLTQLGFGDGQTGDNLVDNNGQITTYFRQTFDLVSANEFDQLTLRIQRDDGAAVYLNGVELVRNNLPSGTLTSTTFASGSINNSNENVWHEYSVDPNLLQAGSNTLAVEIHQATANSSDILFNAELIASDFDGGASPFILTNSTQVNSRTLVGGEFSALTTANLVVPASTSDLRISEIHFNPADPTPSEIAAGFIDNDDFEFLEIFNPNSTGSINLSGLQLANGISFTFDNVDLGPGERAVIVEDTFAFAERYGTDIRVLGQWSGGLSNSGETIDLLDSDLNEIFSVSYADSDPFFEATDGVGFSLVLDDPANTPISELGKYYSYRASTCLLYTSPSPRDRG